MKHFPVHKGGWMVAAFEVSGIIGALLAIGACGTLMFILAWPAPPHGYETTSSRA